MYAVRHENSLEHTYLFKGARSPLEALHLAACGCRGGAPFPLGRVADARRTLSTPTRKVISSELRALFRQVQGSPRQDSVWPPEFFQRCEVVRLYDRNQLAGQMRLRTISV